MVHRRLVLLLCCASMVVVVMDISIVNLALPAIGREFRATISGLQWTVDAYALVLASFMVMAGSAADRFGRRRVFRLGLATFGLGSLACSLAPGIGWLIGARALQAVGGTMLNPVAMAIIATTYEERRERARAIGVFGAVSGLALALGPVVGGALVDGFGWRCVFWVNLPIVGAAILGTTLFVPESRAARPRRFDPVGQVLVFLVLGGVVFAIIESGELGWTAPSVLALLAVAAGGVVGILLVEPRRVDPLLELRLFRNAPFSAAVVTAVLSLCAYGAFAFVTTLYLQEVRGMTPFRAGLCLLPVGAVIMVAAFLAGRLVGARGPRLPLMISGAALALAGAASLFLRPATPLPVVVGVFLLFGVAQGTVNPPVGNSVVSGMPLAMAGVAASLASAARQVGVALGVAISGSLVGAAVAGGGVAFTNAGRDVWWLTIALGAGIGILAILQTTRPSARRRRPPRSHFAENASPGH